MLSGFTWVIEGRLAGSGRPGLLAPLEEDLEFIRGAGFRLLVNLTEEPQAAVIPGLRTLHFPIADMGIPTPRRAAVLCRRIVDEIDRGSPVLVHCQAGLGRTGMVLACCLVSQGVRPRDALARIRSARPLYVQTPAQEKFINHYADLLDSSG